MTLLPPIFSTPKPISTGCRYARSLTRDTLRADDLVHDTLVRALEAEGSLRPNSNLRTWMMTVLHNVFIDDQRRKRVETRHADVLVQMHALTKASTVGLGFIAIGAALLLPTANDITSAIAGTERDVLVAMRKALASKLDDDKIAGNSIAAAYTKLQELDRLIRSIDAEREQEEAAKRADEDRPKRRSFSTSAI